MKSRLLKLFVLLLTFSASTHGLRATEDDVDAKIEAATLVRAGQAAPDFTCQTTDGKTITLSAQKEKVVVLYFFSTSNAASLTEMRYFEKEIFQKIRDRDDFLLLAIGRGHTREELVKISGENKFTFAFAADPKQEIYQRYFSRYVPRTLIIRKDGTIAYLASGYVYETFLRMQEALARELPTSRR